MVIWLKNKEVSSSSRPASCAERATKLSLLSTSTCANSAQQVELEALQACLKQLKPAIEKSDAMLYAPAIQDFPDNCTIATLKCYMLELTMIIKEERIEDGKQDCILDFNDNLQGDKSNKTVNMCPACETYTLQNITIFLDRLKDLLQKMKST